MSSRKVLLVAAILTASANVVLAHLRESVGSALRTAGRQGQHR